MFQGSYARRPASAVSSNHDVSKAEQLQDACEDFQSCRVELEQLLDELAELCSGIESSVAEVQARKACANTRLIIAAATRMNFLKTLLDILDPSKPHEWVDLVDRVVMGLEEAAAKYGSARENIALRYDAVSRSAEGWRGRPLVSRVAS